MKAISPETRMTSRAAMLEMFEKALIAHESVCTSREKITSVPEMLVKTRGNISEVARVLNAHRARISALARDFDCKEHVVVNGVLMTAHGNYMAKRGRP
ncbi:hypothetical protein [Pantoea sp.]|uniref:hypothetical protein n=1 Tax=Pantoea sp. TaxID=69393 RepID=UPI00289E71BC|nr:hypothetical protein [Pantoea sp.]